MSTKISQLIQKRMEMREKTGAFSKGLRSKEKDKAPTPSLEVLLSENALAIDAVKTDVENIFIETGKRPTYQIRTYGCQMNEHDSEKLAAMLEQMGYIPSKNENVADFILFNTCAVRENAHMRVFGNLGSLKPVKEVKKSLKVALCGCMMQQEHIVDELKEKYPYVDLIFGTHNLHTFPKLILAMRNSDRTVIDVWKENKNIVEGIEAKRARKEKAFVNITYGCNKFCSFCIVPYTRGREKSREHKEILQEVKGLIESGAKEITLLGQNVDSYGIDLKNGYMFANLLHDIDNVVNGRNIRIRFMTPHPKDMSDEVIEAIATCDSVCEYVHLPLQAATDKLLKRMRRQYSVSEYMELVNKLKKNIDNLALSTDLIIGFPGEDEEDIDKLIELIKEVDFDHAFTFLFSKRVGTPAYRMKDQIPETIKHKRFERMLSVLNEGVSRKNQLCLGKTYEVLVEGKSKEKGLYVGRNRGNKLIYFPSNGIEAGEFINVKIVEPRKFSLYGEIV